MLFASLPFVPQPRRARILYELASDLNQFTERSLYLNLGYWGHRPATMDAACEALAGLLAESAGLCGYDRVLDVGFGFGDQDLYWMARYAPRLIVGVNITPAQVRVARLRAQRIGAAGLEFVLGTATALPVVDASFTKVLALESSHHFVTRETFFAEAMRVLVVGGCLAMADAVALDNPGERPGFRGRMALQERSFFAAWPRSNWYNREVYEAKLSSAGFVDVRVHSVREEVYPQLMSYLATRLRDPEVSARVNPVHRRRWLRNVRSEPYRRRTLSSFDYVIATARKPEAARV